LSGGDPELANLLGLDDQNKTGPDFDTLFDEKKSGSGLESGNEQFTDISKKGFSKIDKIQENPKPYFKDKEYYKKVLQGTGEISKKVHTLLGQFLGAKDPQDRTIFRNRLIPAYWDLCREVANNFSSSVSIHKKLLLRFGVLAPNLISSDQQNMISRIILNNNTNEPVHYLDEWITMIIRGEVGTSQQDEVKFVKKSANQRKKDIADKRASIRAAELSMLNNKLLERDQFETELLAKAKALQYHDVRSEYNGIKAAYGQDQKSTLSSIPEILRKLSNLDRIISQSYKKLDDLSLEIENLRDKIDDSQLEGADTESVQNEFNTVKQMAKLCVGRQGNHFPILMKQYFRSSIRDIATRENIINTLAGLERLDSGLFLRSYKGEINRIVPHFLIIPCYGDQGVCWEPFERRNKISGRGRLAIPMYPKNLREAIIVAVADLRWQIAKEKAMHYWMEEGFTGRYYQWFEKNKMKGDVKDAFIKDYVLWITKESEGTQKLDKEIRGVFWRMLPFPQDVKDKLKNRGFVYTDLYKKDINISKSDGY
jgi:hypothetical protein